MATDPRAKYRPILDEALLLYPALMNARRDQLPKVRVGYTQVLQYAHGWYMRCHRGITAILTLDEGGYVEEASPLRRSVIEHGVALSWIAVEGDKIVDTIALGHQRSAERRLDAVRTAGWTSLNAQDFIDVLDEIESGAYDKSNNYLLAFAKLLEKYSDPNALPGYLAECGKSHPTYESAMAYVDLPGGGLRSTPREPVPAAPFCTTHLLESLVAVREVFDPKPWREELTDLLERFQRVTDQVRIHDGLKPAEWPELRIDS
jgi:hypothetical protein